MKIATILATLAVASVYSEPLTFNDYQVWRITPSNEMQVNVLQTMRDTSNEFNFWSMDIARNLPVDVMLAPNQIDSFFNRLNTTQSEHTLFVHNVQSLINTQQPALRSSLFDWTSYGTLDQIYDWLRDIANKYEEVELIEAGTSYEGRKILGVKLSYGKQNENRGVFLEGCIHAREWISSAVVTYQLNELLTSTNPDVRKIAENHDWYVFPNINPDGYVYTHTTNRMWRKTRSLHGICQGADPNRNWDYEWNVAGTSNWPCSESYAGPKPFSEIEMKTLSNYIASIGQKLKAYIAHHSYSQMLLLPFGSGKKPSNFEELMTVGKKVVNALEAPHGTKFVYGNVAETIYPATGGSMDWVKGNFDTRFAYTYELRDTGRFGFLLPAKYIKPSGEEVLNALVTMIQELDKVV